MEKILCPSCGASLPLTTATPFLTCEYCDTAVPNAYYDEDSAKAAAVPTLEETCVAELLEMGRSEKLAETDETCFGEPLFIADTTRDALEIPQTENVYLLYDRFSIFGNVKEGFALAETGLYYMHDGETGRRSWEAFVTGAISGTEPAGLFQDGSLSVGTSLTFPLSGDADARLARFVVDFHNHMYQKHTGDAAPAAWKLVSAEAAAAASVPSAHVQQDDGPSLAQTVIGAAATLLTGGSILNQTRTAVTNRYPQQHARPAMPQIIRQNAPAKPAHPRPVSRPATAKPLHRPHTQTARPGMERPGTSRPAVNRPAAAPTNRPVGRPGPDRPGMGRPGGTGRPGGRGRR